MSLGSLQLKLATLPEPLRIGIGLGLGFAVTLMLVILVMIVSFSYMAKIYADLEKITQISNVKIELAHTMKYAQRDRAVHLYALALIKDDFEKDEELQKFNRKGAEFLRAWNKFQSIEMNAQEKVLAEHINKLPSERSRAVQDAIAYAVSHYGLAAAEYMRTVAIPGQQDMAGEIERLLSLQQVQSHQSVLSAAVSYSNARMLMIWLCCITLTISILVAVIALRQFMRQSRALEYKTLFDDLTGLPNRAMFFDRMGQAALVCKNENKPFSIVVIDLDRFKEVNDMLGHHVGDLLLKHVAKTINSAMRRTDTIARLGGDEFVLLLPAVTAANAEVIVKKLLSALCHRVALDDSTVDVAASMGIASYPEHDVDISRLLLKANMAMYAAKRANVGYRVYTPEIETVAARNLEKQIELRHAIENEQLLLHYQPKISHHTGCIMGVEALVRWNHPQRGLIFPDEFIPMAESSGLIQPLAIWVLQAALQQAVKWHEAGHEFTVSVNLSTRNLLDSDLPGRVARLLANYRIKPEWLIFEITESAVMAEPDRALETLNKLHKMGIQISLDDFGAGYSSLAYLKKLPVSEIKIDKSFIKDMELDASDTVIVRSTVALGHNLGMQVVAEGVEDLEVWELLTALGCDSSQGYYMSRPMSAEALNEWLLTSSWARKEILLSDIYVGDERRENVRETSRD